MFFRIRTRLLVASALTLTLLIALTLLVVMQLRSLGPAIERFNQLSAIVVKTRNLTIAAQYASADMDAALTGVSNDQQQALDFDRQMFLLGKAVADMRGDFAAISISESLAKSTPQFSKRRSSTKRSAINCLRRWPLATPGLQRKPETLSSK